MWKPLLFVMMGLTSAWYTSPSLAADEVAPTSRKKIVLIAGRKSHGPEGNRIHDYPWSVRLIKVMLDNSNVADRVKVEFHLNGWPKDQSTLEDADTIMVISDGRDGDKFEEAPHLKSADRVAFIDKQMKRGCGFLTFHFSTFAPDQYAKQILRWSGGYFDWETGGKRQWYSAIRTIQSDVQFGAKDHPVLRGVKPFNMKEEFYFNLRFDPNDKALSPLLVVPALKGRQPDGNMVAWAKQRSVEDGGGRGFGTTCGHFYDNWKNADFRRMVLNAIVWTAGAELPKGGVEASYYEHDDITASLKGITGTQRAIAKEASAARTGIKPIRALILTGHDGPFHPWKPKTVMLQKALEQDDRFHVTVTADIEDLAKLKPGDYDVLLLNYCNYKLPTPLSEASKRAFVDYLKAGGGLTIVHFSNGAWHRSLPGAANTDWPEFRKICRRVWDHDAKSAHDAFGKLNVNVTEVKHPITQGMKAWETTDELYFNQAGDEAIEPLVTAVSKLSGKPEPLAWAYDYGKGRVFQTLLGHNDRSLMWGGTAQLMRRGSVWAAGRDQRDVGRKDINPKDVTKPVQPQNADGQTPRGATSLSKIFGNALSGGMVVKGDARYRGAPISVECWTKLNSKQAFNILVASEAKASPSHWEIYSYAGSGAFSLYMPGRGGEYRTKVDICDGRWHHVAATIETNRVRLYIDGKLALDKSTVPPPLNAPGATGLAFGRLVEGRIGCDGVIDDVRISKSVRKVDALPTKPREADEQTLGLWSFDDLKVSSSAPPDTSPMPTATPNRSDAKVLPADVGLDGGKGGHWGTKGEEDWVDNRVRQMQFGPFFSHTFESPGHRANKGIAVRVGDDQQAAVLLDSQTGALVCGWTGAFIALDRGRFGLIGRHKIAEKIKWQLGDQLGFRGAKKVQYRGLHRDGKRVVFEYDVDGVRVRDTPWAFTVNGVTAFTRDLQIGAGFGDASIVINDGQCFTAVHAPTEAGFQVGWSKDRKRMEFTMAKRTTELRVRLMFISMAHQQNSTFASFAAARKTPIYDFDRLAKGGKPLWGKPIEVVGHLGKSDRAYTIDTIPVPYDNPHKALMFLSGVDFFANGDAAVCTVHGDVWLVRGINDQLKHITWQRFATGLFQPLGLKIVDDQVHVLGRDQITRLHDRNADGEADFYECFFNGIHTSAGGHDYVACLETDAKGNFYYVDPRGVHRIAKDGSAHHTIATGFRNPNGMSVGPDGTITVAPQEGNWTPASMICQVKAEGYYGYGGPRVSAARPKGYDPPLVYLPRLLDNSTGSQVWVTSDRWGPLKGQLLNLSFGRSAMQLLLREKVGDVTQGAVVPMSMRFLSGVTRGRFHPIDGQLYVIGMQGWVTNAVRDGCFQRVRYTGKAVKLPIGMQTNAKGIRLTFSQRLDRALAQDTESYAVEQWNYRYSKAYGSKDYSVRQPSIEGHDQVKVMAATLEADGRTVFIQLEGLTPVHQLRIRYDLDTVNGDTLRGQVVATIHQFGNG